MYAVGQKRGKNCLNKNVLVSDLEKTRRGIFFILSTFPAPLVSHYFKTLNVLFFGCILM